MTRTLYLATALALVGSLAGILFAQRGGRIGGGGGRFRGGGFGGGALTDLSVDRRGIPTWPVDPQFRSDVFTFVRVIYSSPKYGSGGGWSTDYPDSDLNFPFRLQQMTSLKVDPVPKQLRLTDPEIFRYPFLYMLEIGRLEFTEEEVACLRRYLTNGGFLMVDDHWGEREYENFREEIARVFPNKQPQELDISHPIFHCVFDLKEKPQVPNINLGIQSPYNGGITWEREDAREPHYRAIYDDKGRMMVIICSNTDLGDGWEREGENEYYFREFSVKKAYPMGINIVFYAMTH
jgi:hypothetical protein